MRVEGDDGAFPAWKVANKVFQFVSELVGHTVFHRGGQIQNDLVVRIGVECRHNRIANLVCGVHFGAHKGLRRVLITNVDASLEQWLTHFVNHFGGVSGDLLNSCHIGVEYNLAL